MATKKHPRTYEELLADATSADYAKSMFENGGNRTETNQKAHDAPLYDRAAHRGEANFPANQNNAEVTASVHTFHSRDGTDAAGLYDENGGPIGGTEEELDALEVSAAPVDRTPQAKA